MKNIFLKQENCAWLIGKKILRRDDVLSPFCLSKAPRIKADIITRFVKKTGFENGDSFTSYLDGTVQLTPLEYNIYCKLLALRWAVTDTQPAAEDDEEYLDYFRINHFFEKRLGVSFWLWNFFPPLYPYPQLQEIEMEKEFISYSDLKEFYQATRPFNNLVMDEIDLFGRAGCVSAVLRWREQEHDRILAKLPEVTPARACTSCKQNNWRLLMRRFGIYWRCKTKRCRGVQEARVYTEHVCLVCGKGMYKTLGVGGKKICACVAYPSCSCVRAEENNFSTKEENETLVVYN